jgi:hypothetical protein
MASGRRPAANPAEISSRMMSVVGVKAENIFSSGVFFDP